MSFSSWQYIFFLLLVLAAYWSMKRRGQNRLLLAASLFFYGSWNWGFLFLLLAATSIDFFVALRIAASESPIIRKRLLILSLALNLGILGVFKYAGFFLESLHALLSGLGFGVERVTLAIILPIGISFYTFQAMGYVIDVYRRHIPAAKSLPDYFLFITFFPQLVAGPIERAGHLLPQFAADRKFDRRQFLCGVDLILWGLIKKVAIADNVAYYVNLIFQLEHPSMLLIAVGAVGFSVQAFCDFSGYSDIACGSAKLLGIEVMRNFNLPYLSRSVSELWTRWHISLSEWVRDYIFIPLGGSRCSRTRYVCNVFVTWALMGLWHGAAWHFVVWGLYHAALLVIYRLVFEGRGYLAFLGGRLSALTSILMTYAAFTIGLIFFRGPNLTRIADYFSAVAWQASFGDLRIAYILTVIFLFFSVPLLVGLLWHYRLQSGRFDFSHLNAWRIVYYSVGAACLLIFGGVSNDFIYFQF